MRLYRCKESFKYKSLVTTLEETVHKGQLFLVEDPQELPSPQTLGWFMLYEEYEMLARKG